MKARCVSRFYDLEDGCLREPGDEWELAPERLEAINAAGYGKLAEEAPRQSPKAPRRAKGRSDG